MAVLRGDNTEVKELIARGADINSRDEPDGWTPLLYSIYYNNQRALQFLLDQGADIEKEDYANRTPAIFAAIRGDYTLLAELIIRGADIHRRDIRGKNALDFAREYHQQKCIELLEQYNK
jgi:ankyrin repeat protein